MDFIKNTNFTESVKPSVLVYLIFYCGFTC